MRAFHKKFKIGVSHKCVCVCVLSPCVPAKFSVLSQKDYFKLVPTCPYVITNACFYIK